MKTPVKICLGVVGVLALLGFAGYKMNQPHLRGATVQEIMAALPPEMTKAPPTDSVAQARYKRLEELAKSMDRTMLGNLSPTAKRTSEERRVATDQLYDQNLTPVLAILNEGPIANPKPSPWPMIASNLFAYSRAIVEAGRQYAIRGEFDKSEKLLHASIKLSLAFAEGGLDEGGIVELTMLRGANASITAGGFPPAACKRLLSELPGCPMADPPLKERVRQTMLMLTPDLGKTDGYGGVITGNADNKMPGSYDAIETTHLMASALLEQMSNTDKPMSEASHKAVDEIESLAKKLPPLPPDYPQKGISGWWTNYKFQLSMNHAENSIGIKLAQEIATTRDSALLSYKRRVTRECLRIRMSAIVYKSEHGGALPTTIDEFKPYLGAWPLDPFNGKPMIYNVKKGVVYSVGENLIDDGGSILRFVKDAPDLGASLKI